MGVDLVDTNIRDLGLGFIDVGGQRLDIVAPRRQAQERQAVIVAPLAQGLQRPRGLGQHGVQLGAAEPALFGGWYSAPSPKGRESFEKVYAETYGQKPPRLASLAYDATALADLHHLIEASEAYFADHLQYPAALADLTDWVPSKGVVVTRFDGAATEVHIHLGHQSSSHYYHINYPFDDIEKRPI